MKQIEITAKVNQSMEEIHDILSNQGFSFIRNNRVEDKYMTLDYDELAKDTILDVLQTCILIRYVKLSEDKEFKNLTYKKKEYQGNTVISEEKIIVDIDDVDKAELLLESVGFQKIVEVKYDVFVYKKGPVELCFQDVDGLGLMVEYENPLDFTGKTSKEILQEKQKMAEELKSYHIDITSEYDVKKAYQLISNRMKV